MRSFLFSDSKPRRCRGFFVSGAPRGGGYEDA
nr:MAG TPA: protein of unknown function (DUF2102) [Caudoviricetes sp.]